jgi:hypothetical protein
MRTMPALIFCAITIALPGCGDSNSDTTSTRATPSPPTTTVAEPSGPVVRICDRTLARDVLDAFRSNGFRGALPSRPTPSGNATLSVCELEGERADVSISLDAASGAVRRYRNRVTETAQFSGGDPDRAPHTVKGVGDPRLGAAGANWLPRIHLLLSARGERVLIVDVSADGLEDDALRAAAIEISLDAWDRLER